MPDQPTTVKRDFERPKWVRWAFVGVVVLAIVVTIAWWATSDEGASGGEPTAAARAPEEVWMQYFFQTDEEYRANAIKGLEKTTLANPADPVFDKDGELVFVTYQFDEGRIRRKAVIGTLDVKSGFWQQPGSSGTCELLDFIPAVEYRWKCRGANNVVGTSILRKEFR